LFACLFVTGAFSAPVMTGAFSALVARASLFVPAGTVLFVTARDRLFRSTRGLLFVIFPTVAFRGARRLAHLFGRADRGGRVVSPTLLGATDARPAAVARPAVARPGHGGGKRGRCQRAAGKHGCARQAPG
jgi:hypothetical protein